jgi:antitoxin component YwqK of YwqJK toxin-antitoxin module
MNERKSHVEYWPSGRKKFEATLVNGSFHGIVRAWYESGQTHIESAYSYGVADGLSTTWFENGHLQKQGHVANGMEEGVWTEWHANGNKKEEGTYRSGQMLGLSRSWHENGKVRSEVSFEGGLPNGLMSYWYPSGKKEREVHLNHGKMNGTATSWHESGARREERLFRNDGLIGLPTAWSESGKRLFHPVFQECCACGSTSWLPGPDPMWFRCKTCMFCIDYAESLEEMARRAARWTVFPSAEAGLPPRFRTEARGLGATPTFPDWLIEGAARFDRTKGSKVKELQDWLSRDPSDEEQAQARQHIESAGFQAEDDDLIRAVSIMLRIREHRTTPQGALTRRPGCLLGLFPILG